MILPYLKYSWFFVIVLLISSVFAYTGFNEFSSYSTQIFYSFSLSLLLHFLVFQLFQLFVKNRHVFNVILLIFSMLILTMNIGFYVGVKNWGTPVNIDLVKAGLSNFGSTLTIGLRNVTFLISSILGILILYYFFNWNSKKVFPLERGGQTNLKHRLLFLLINILAIVGLGFFYTKIGATDKGSVKEEVYYSFFKKPKSLLSIDELELGVENKAKSYPKIENFDKKNVILISVDCLRHDHLSFNGYSRKTTPFLDSLYAQNKLKKFKLSTSTCSSSFCGILTTLNSKNLQGLSYFKYGIQDYLKTQGYRTNFILSGVHEGWYDIKKHYGKNIDHYVEGKDKPEFGVHDDALIVDEVSRIPDYSDEPNFFFFHFMSPHTLGDKDPSNELFKPVMEKSLIRQLRLGGQNDENLQALYTNNYDNGVFQADQYIKAVLATLRKKGYLDNAIVAITGDHGESLGENSAYFGHGNALTDEYINVPILFIEDNINMYREEVYASHIDIAPTIISRLGLPIPDVWQGLDLTQKQNNRVTHHEQTPYGFEKSHIGVISSGNNIIRKYIVDQNSGDEIIFQTNFTTNVADTLYLTQAIKNYFREEVLKYKGDDYVEFKDIADVLSTKRALVGEIKQPNTEGESEFRKPCESFTKELFSEVFKTNRKVLRTVSVNKDLKSCTCHFLWKSRDNENNEVRITASVVPNVKRKVRSLANEENFTRARNEFSNIYFNRKSKEIVWISGQFGFVELQIEDGKNVSFNVLLKFVKNNFSENAKPII